MAGKQFGQNLPVNRADILQVKNFVEIALAHTVSEMSTFFAFSALRKFINVYLCFTQKFKMAAKSGGKRFLRKLANTLYNTLWVRNFVEIALVHSVS